MNNQTLKALKGSIEKWRKIIEEDGEDDGTLDCPLCYLFLKKTNSRTRCVGCPVFEETGDHFCRKSPWGDWAMHHEEGYHLLKGERPFRIECGECRLLAKAELRFLRSLLPKEKP